MTRAGMWMAYRNNYSLTLGWFAFIIASAVLSAQPPIGF